MSRFVVLEHSWQGVHWDLMLETGKTLRTWALAQPPDSTAPVPATRLADHRHAYLDYEGPIPGDRGTVRRWDRGEFEWLEQETARAVVRLQGTRLKGEARLELCDAPTGWVYQWRPTGSDDVGC